MIGQTAHELAEDLYECIKVLDLDEDDIDVIKQELTSDNELLHQSSYRRFDSKLNEALNAKDSRRLSSEALESKIRCRDKIVRIAKQLTPSIREEVWNEVHNKWRASVNEAFPSPAREYSSAESKLGTDFKAVEKALRRHLEEGVVSVDFKKNEKPADVMERPAYPAWQHISSSKKKPNRDIKTHLVNASILQNYLSKDNIQQLPSILCTEACVALYSKEETAQLCKDQLLEAVSFASRKENLISGHEVRCTSFYAETLRPYQLNAIEYSTSSRGVLVSATPDMAQKCADHFLGMTNFMHVLSYAGLTPQTLAWGIGKVPIKEVPSDASRGVQIAKTQHPETPTAERIYNLPNLDKSPGHLDGKAQPASKSAHSAQYWRKRIEAFGSVHADSLQSTTEEARRNKLTAEEKSKACRSRRKTQTTDSIQPSATQSYIRTILKGDGAYGTAISSAQKLLEYFGVCAPSGDEFKKLEGAMHEFYDGEKEDELFGYDHTREMNTTCTILQLLDDACRVGFGTQMLRITRNDLAPHVNRAEAAKCLISKIMQNDNLDLGSPWLPADSDLASNQRDVYNNLVYLRRRDALYKTLQVNPRRGTPEFKQKLRIASRDVARPTKDGTKGRMLSRASALSLLALCAINYQSGTAPFKNSNVRFPTPGLSIMTEMKQDGYGDLQDVLRAIALENNSNEEDTIKNLDDHYRTYIHSARSPLADREAAAMKFIFELSRHLAASKEADKEAAVRGATQSAPIPNASRIVEHILETTRDRVPPSDHILWPKRHGELWLGDDSESDYSFWKDLLHEARKIRFLKLAHANPAHNIPLMMMARLGDDPQKASQKAFNNTVEDFKQNLDYMVKMVHSKSPMATRPFNAQLKDIENKYRAYVSVWKQDLIQEIRENEYHRLHSLAYESLLRHFAEARTRLLPDKEKDEETIDAAAHYFARKLGRVHNVDEALRLMDSSLPFPSETEARGLAEATLAVVGIHDATDEEVDRVREDLQHLSRSIQLENNPPDIAPLIRTLKHLLVNEKARKTPKERSQTVESRADARVDAAFWGWRITVPTERINYWKDVFLQPLRGSHRNKTHTGELALAVCRCLKGLAGAGVAFLGVRASDMAWDISRKNVVLMQSEYPLFLRETNDVRDSQEWTAVASMCMLDIMFLTTYLEWRKCLILVTQEMHLTLDSQGANAAYAEMRVATAKILKNKHRTSRESNELFRKLAMHDIRPQPRKSGDLLENAPSDFDNATFFVVLSQNIFDLWSSHCDLIRRAYDGILTSSTRKLLECHTRIRGEIITSWVESLQPLLSESFATSSPSNQQHPEHPHPGHPHPEHPEHPHPEAAEARATGATESPPLPPPWALSAIDGERVQVGTEVKHVISEKEEEEESKGSGSNSRSTSGEAVEQTAEYDKNKTESRGSRSNSRSTSGEAVVQTAEYDKNKTESRGSRSNSRREFHFYTQHGVAAVERTAERDKKKTESKGSRSNSRSTSGEAVEQTAEYDKNKTESRGSRSNSRREAAVEQTTEHDKKKTESKGSRSNSRSTSREAVEIPSDLISDNGEDSLDESDSISNLTHMLRSLQLGWSIGSVPTKIPKYKRMLEQVRYIPHATKKFSQLPERERESALDIAIPDLPHRGRLGRDGNDVYDLCRLPNKLRALMHRDIRWPVCVDDMDTMPREFSLPAPSKVYFPFEDLQVVDLKLSVLYEECQKIPTKWKEGCKMENVCQSIRHIIGDHCHFGVKCSASSELGELEPLSCVTLLGHLHEDFHCTPAWKLPHLLSFLPGIREGELVGFAHTNTIFYPTQLAPLSSGSLNFEGSEAVAMAMRQCFVAHNMLLGCLHMLYVSYVRVDTHALPAHSSPPRGAPTRKYAEANPSHKHQDVRPDNRVPRADKYTVRPLDPPGPRHERATLTTIEASHGENGKISKQVTRFLKEREENLERISSSLPPNAHQYHLENVQEAIGDRPWILAPHCAYYAKMYRTTQAMFAHSINNVIHSHDAKTQTLLTSLDSILLSNYSLPLVAQDQSTHFLFYVYWSHLIFSPGWLRFRDKKSQPS